MVVGVGRVEKTITVLLLFLWGQEADRNCCDGLMALETFFSISLFDSSCRYLLGFFYCSLILFIFFF